MKRTLALGLLFLSGVVASADHLPAKMQAPASPKTRWPEAAIVQWG
jgi:hypothetical protein